MQAHIEQTTTSLTTCIYLEQVAPGTQILTVTAFNRPLTIDGRQYESFGFLRQDVSGNGNMEVPTTEVVGILNSATITEDDLRAGKWDFASYKLFQVNWDDLSMGRIQLSEGNIGIVRAGLLKFTAELLGLMQGVQSGIGNLTSPACIHKFAASEGGPGLGNGCTIDVNGSPSFIRFGTVEAMDADFHTITDSARTEPNNTFTNGIFTILPTSPPGFMDGMQFEVRAYQVGIWVLFGALPYDATGLDYSITFGCDKSRRMCIDVFDNILDRLASDYTQGNDAAIQVARHGQNTTTSGSGVPGAPSTGAPNPVNFTLLWNGSNSPHHTAGVRVGDIYVVQFTTDSDPVGPGNIDVAEFGDPATFRYGVIATDTAATHVLTNGTQYGNSLSFIFGSSPGEVNLAANTTYYLVVRMPSPPSTLGDNCDMVIEF
jgi:uncharacterized phage protein (TIGR02218 family)